MDLASCWPDSSQETYMRHHSWEHLGCSESGKLAGYGSNITHLYLLALA